MTLPTLDFGDAAQPAVLFLHGFMGSGEDWRATVETLQPDYRCLTVDLPGHGAAIDLPDGAYTMAGAARAVIEVLNHHEINRCHLVGYSMGGRLALYLALQYPERFRRLVLESASPGLRAEEERAARRAIDEARARRLETGSLGRFLDDWYRQPLFSSLHDHPGLVERIVAARRRNRPAELARSLRAMGTGQQPSLWERLSGLSVATLAVAGALDRKYVGLARQMASASPRVRAVVVPAAGHSVHAERPGRFAAVLRAFLTSTDPALDA